MRMILQPIVENAVYHGIRPYRTDGTIQITVRRKEEDIEICVGDDGGGVAEDVLMKVRPVSYTHLDVYKRQELFLRLSVCIFYVSRMALQSEKVTCLYVFVLSFFPYIF